MRNDAHEIRYYEWNKNDFYKYCETKFILIYGCVVWYFDCISNIWNGMEWMLVILLSLIWLRSFIYIWPQYSIYLKRQRLHIEKANAHTHTLVDEKYIENENQTAAKSNNINKERKRHVKQKKITTTTTTFKWSKAIITTHRNGESATVELVIYVYVILLYIYLYA